MTIKFKHKKTRGSHRVFPRHRRYWPPGFTYFTTFSGLYKPRAPLPFFSFLRFLLLSFSLLSGHLSSSGQAFAGTSSHHIASHPSLLLFLTSSSNYSHESGIVSSISSFRCFLLFFFFLRFRFFS